jgi:type II secretory pathway component PulF
MSLLGILGIFVIITKILPQNIEMFESMGLTVPSFLTFANYFVHILQYHWFSLFFLIPMSLNSQYLNYRTFLRMQYIKYHTPIGHLRFLQDKSTLLNTLSLLGKTKN